MNSGGPPGGPLGTADACLGPLPYQDPSARHSATLYTHTHTHYPSLRLAAPRLSLHLRVQRRPNRSPGSNIVGPDRRILLEASQSPGWLAGGGGGGGGGGGEGGFVALGEVSTADQAPSVILAVARGYDTFNIVFMATGDSRANECFSVASTQWLKTACPEKNTVYNRAFISTAFRVQTPLWAKGKTRERR